MIFQKGRCHKGQTDVIDGVKRVHGSGQIFLEGRQKDQEEGGKEVKIGACSIRSCLWSRPLIQTSFHRHPS